MKGSGAHAVEPFIPLTPAAVVEHRAVEWNDRLGGGDHKLAIEEVMSTGFPEGEVGGVAGLVFWLVLTDLDVGGACGDLHHIGVALTVCQGESGYRVSWAANGYDYADDSFRGNINT